MSTITTGRLLHAHDVLRNQLVPVNARIGLHQVLQVPTSTSLSGRRLTYVLRRALPISPNTAELAQRRSRPALLNVIPTNRSTDCPTGLPEPAASRRFRELLEQGGVNAVPPEEGDMMTRLADNCVRRRFGEGPWPGAGIAPRSGSLPDAHRVGSPRSLAPVAGLHAEASDRGRHVGVARTVRHGVSTPVV
jgi:hypothetical protein